MAIAIGSFFLGRISVSSLASGKSGSAPNGNTSRQTLAANKPPEADLKRRPRTERPKKEPSRISISVESARNALSALKDTPGFDWQFERIESNLDSTLALLGASPNESENIKSLFAQAKSDLYATEKTHIAVASANASFVTLDLSEMEKPSKQIIDSLKKQIHASLDPERAALLETAIPWNRFYPLPDQLSVDFSIVRRDKALMISEAGDGYRRETRLDPGAFPDNGQPVSAFSAFAAGGPDSLLTGRWQSFMEGRTLTPVDPNGKDR